VNHKGVAGVLVTVLVQIQRPQCITMIKLTIVANNGIHLSVEMYFQDYNGIPVSILLPLLGPPLRVSLSALIHFAILSKYVRIN